MYPNAIFGSVTLYDICFMLGILAALVVARVYAEKLHIAANLQNAGILLAAFAILAGYGSAILFQGFYDYLETGVFALNEGTGVTFYGGLIGGAALFLIVWFTLVRKLCGREAVEIFPQVLGIAACSIAIAHAIGRVGCLMAGCCHGAETDSWLGVYQPGSGIAGKVIPTQLFEAVFLFELFLILTYMLFRTRGNGIAVYMLLYGFFRFVNEFLRTDDRGSFIPGLTPSQAWSVLLFAAGAVWLAAEYFIRKRKKEQKKEH